MILDKRVISEITEVFEELRNELLDIENKVKELQEKYVLEYTNLKLHDVSYFVYQNEAYNDNDFNLFCELEYMFFEDWIKESDYHIEFDHIGRTSTFKIVPTHMESYLLDSFTEERYNSTRLSTLDTVYSLAYNVGYFKDDLIELVREDNLDGLLNRFNYDDEIILNELKEVESVLYQIKEEMTEVESQLIECVKVYEYIQDFKENQVAYFKDWVQHNKTMYDNERI